MREVPGCDHTITGQGCPLTGMERCLAAPQIFFTLGHQKGVTNVTVVKVLKEQSLREGARCQKTEIPSKWMVVRSDERPQRMTTITKVQGQKEHQESSLDYL